MEYTPVKLQRWEKDHYKHNMKRMYKTSKDYRCPRQERLADYRRSYGSGNRFNKEDAAVRVSLQRTFRRKLKQQLHCQVYDRPVPHDYKTYGWISW